MLDIIIKLFIINDPTPLKIQQFKEDLQQVGINLKIFLWKIAFSIVVAIILMEFGILDQVYELAKKLTIFIQHNIKATSYSITS